MIIRIKNLRLNTIIGLYDFERTNKQDIIINIKIETDDTKAATSDNIEDSVDYNLLTKEIIEKVERTNFQLLEKLANFILDIIFENKKVNKATVEIDKPAALDCADSVSVEFNRTKE